MKKLLLLFLILTMRHTQASDETDLMTALYSEDLARVNEEIIKAKDAGTLNKYITRSVLRSTNPILYAAEYYTPALLPLIEAGADVNVRDADIKTPLFKTDEPALIEMLSKVGANANAKDIDGKAPLHYVKTLETADALIKAGAKLDSKDLAGKTPLIYVIEANKIDIAKLMLAIRPDLVHKKDRNKNTLFRYAQTAEMAELLLNAGADPKETNTEGKTPLHQAANNHNTELINVLAPKSTLESYDSYGCTPLHYAARSFHVTEWSPGEALIKAGATVSARVEKNKKPLVWGEDVKINEIGNTPLHIAALTGCIDVARLLLKHTRPPKPCAPQKTKESLV